LAHIVLLLSAIIGGPKGRDLCYKLEALYFREPTKFHTFLSDGPIKLAHNKTKKIELEVGGTSSK
jgi:hypothetical protein